MNYAHISARLLSRDCRVCALERINNKIAITNTALELYVAQTLLELCRYEHVQGFLRVNVGFGL